MADTTYMSPNLADTQLPTDGVPIVQPKEQNPTATISSPVIVDKDLAYVEANTNSSTGGSGGDQTINGVVKIGTAITLDGPNKRIVINDGTYDRIIIGFYSL